MRSSEPWRASALMAALVLAGATGAQPPDQKPAPPRRLVQPAASVDDMVERIVAFDKNKDGKLTKDELPERMHDLFTRGDTNKDGALDKDEIRNLASTPGGLPPAGPGTPVFAGPGPGATIGFGAGGPVPDRLEGVVDDLKLSGKTKDHALAVVKAHEENVRKLMNQARADMLEKMKGVLSEEEFKDFKAAVDRGPPFGERRAVFNFNVGPGGPPGPGGPEQRILGPAGTLRPGELERKLNQLQKELDELRKELRR
jgi:hypothetical protein